MATTKGRAWFVRKVRELGEVLRRLPAERQDAMADAATDDDRRAAPTDRNGSRPSRYDEGDEGLH